MMTTTGTGPSRAAGAGGIHFRKMHGIGNDFVLLDARTGAPAHPAVPFIRALGDRRCGIGFDQLVVLSEGDDEADATAAFWNADGSRAGACGNGTRCAAELLLEGSGQPAVNIRTAAGLLACVRRADGGVQVAMGVPQLDWRDIPLAEPRDTCAFAAPLPAAGLVAEASAVGMGNPHCVLFVNSLDEGQVMEHGPRIERDPLFPEGVNVSFAEVLAPERIRLRVWERGAGATLACGSAACATLVAAVRRGLTGRSVAISFAAGELFLEWPDDDSPVQLSGPVARVAEGVIDPAFVSAHHAG